MIVNNVSLEVVAVNKDQYPENNKPEIAFVGKSNVGKSSLINVMINRRSLARTSQTPGKTRTINFYNVEDMLYFVDLPGYGYAKASKVDIEAFGKATEKYLTDRTQLKNIIMLIDSRHEPGANDKKMYNWLKYYNYKIVVVATKVDKLSKNKVEKHMSIIKKGLSLEANEIVIPFSSKSKIGISTLWDTIKASIV